MLVCCKWPKAVCHLTLRILGYYLCSTLYPRLYPYPAIYLIIDRCRTHETKSHDVPLDFPVPPYLHELANML